MSPVQSNSRQNASREKVTVDGGRPALDRVLEGLSRKYDRCVLYHLVDSEPAEFEELVNAVVAVKAEGTGTVPADVRKEIRIELYHMRLPKLEDLGIIEFDPRSGLIRYRNPPPHFEEFLHLARELDEE